MHLAKLAFRSALPEVKDAVMAGLVVSLSKQDIADIAAYYAAQTGLFTVEYTGK